MANIKVATIPNEFSQDFESVLAMLSKNEIDYLELASMWGKSVLELTPAEEDKVEKLMDEYGMQTSAIQTQIMKCHPIGSPYAKPGSKNMHGDHDFNISQIDRAIELADRFKTKNIVTYSYYSKSGVTEENWKAMLDDYAGLIKKCAAANKTMVLENEHDCYVALVDDIARIMNHFDSPNLRWLFDTGNLFMRVDDFTQEDYDKVGKFIGYWHVKDVKKKWIFGKRKMWAVFGTGFVPLEKIFSYFIKDGYNGFISAEPHQGGPKRWKLAEQHVLNMKKCLESL